jgi:hypothetical protein
MLRRPTTARRASLTRPVTWNELLSTLVGFVGREVHAQVWNAADPDAEGSVVILTAFGTLTDSDPRFEAAMATDMTLVRLTRGDEVSAVVSLTRERFVSAQLLDADRLEVTFDGALVGIYAS